MCFPTVLIDYRVAHHLVDLAFVDIKLGNSTDPTGQQGSSSMSNQNNILIQQKIVLYEVLSHPVHSWRYSQEKNQYLIQPCRQAGIFCSFRLIVLLPSRVRPFEGQLQAMLSAPPGYSPGSRAESPIGQFRITSIGASADSAAKTLHQVTNRLRRC